MVYVVDPWQSDSGPTECKIESRILKGVAKVSVLCLNNDEELLPYAPDAEGIIISHLPQLTRKSLSQLPRMRVIVRKGVGVDNVDTVAAREFGIPVCNVPDYGTEEVADHALSLALTLWRRVVPLNDNVRAGHWDWWVARDIKRTRGCVFGVVGCGRIGTAAIRRARAFGFDSVFEDPYLPSGYEKALGVRRVDTLNELLQIADIVSFHVPLTEETHHFMGQDQFQQLKPGACLVNTSRGPIIDEKALVEALKAGRLGGVALDVLDHEPVPPPELLSSHNCILTPHVGFYSAEALTEFREKCALLVLDALTGKKVRNVVN